MVQSPLMDFLLGKNNHAAENLMMMAQGAGLIDVIMQGYQAYKEGKLPEFAVKMYESNITFRKFYDKNKDKTLETFFAENRINLK